MYDETGLDARARRAIPLIAAALTVIVVAGLLYLRATAPPAPVTGAPPVPTLDGRYSAGYDFISPSIGWAIVLQQGAPTFWIYRTTDGAHSWKKLFGGTLAQAQPPAVKFFDEDHGVFYAGALYRTEDGGGHWSAISLPGATSDFAFASPTRGWAIVFDSSQADHLYSTSDGGLFWHRIDSPLPAGATVWGRGVPMSLDFRPSGEGWLGAVDSSRPTAYSTVDGGASWNRVAVPIPPAHGAPPAGKGGLLAYNTFVALVPGHGVIAMVSDSFGATGAFASSDLGRSWSAISMPPSPAQIGDISFVDARRWWASRYGVIFQTSDAGLTWTEVRQVAPDLLGDWTSGSAHVIDANHAWLVMTSSNRRNPVTALEMTSDGGVHWKAVNPPVPG
ncbi:MAG TPA: hypothetical protein VGE99_08095 [Candidatus Dormibacteraeota bacterium]